MASVDVDVDAEWDGEELDGEGEGEGEVWARILRSSVGELMIHVARPPTAPARNMLVRVGRAALVVWEVSEYEGVDEAVMEGWER